MAASPAGAAQAPDIRPFRSPSLHPLRQVKQPPSSYRAAASSVRATRLRARMHEPEPVTLDDRLEPRVRAERAEQPADVVPSRLLGDAEPFRDRGRAEPFGEE